MRTIDFSLVLAVTLVPVQAACAGEDARFPRGSGAVVIFCCDFGHYPPLGNVEISQEACDYSIFYDQRPHLRFLLPRKSHLSMQFSLPQAPKAAFLEAVHLASEDAKGNGVSPISIIINGKTVVKDWNVGKTKFTETRWAVGDKLRSGRNEIRWVAGELRTHYWLRRVMLYVCFDRTISVSFPILRVEHALFWEGRYSQCSYNALATVLDHFYGVEPWTGDREPFEKQTFVAALKKFKLGGYFGWAPWTSYMVQSRTIRWNGHPVADLKAERFALRTKETPKPEAKEMIVRYQPGEKAALEERLLSYLKKGPVIIWTPYAAAMDRGRGAWQHVRSLDPRTDAVRFHANMTHSVVISLEGDKLEVYDNSWPWGVWAVQPETVVATTAAMAGSVRVRRGKGKTLLGKGFHGIDNDQYNVVFWKD